MNTNVVSLMVQRNLSEVNARLAGRYARLSSGLRIASAADDPAGLGISERMRVQIRSHAVAARNIQDGISLVQTAEGSLGEVSNMLGRVRELIMSAQNGTQSSADRSTLNNEYEAIVDEIGRVTSSTEFNGISLLDSDGSVAIRVGSNGGYISIQLQDMSSISSTLESFDLEDDSLIDGVHSIIDSLISEVSGFRGELGASEIRLTSALSTSLTTRHSLAAAESRIRDVDFARESALLMRDVILQQAAVSVLAQANLMPQLALSLIRGATG